MKEFLGCSSCISPVAILIIFTFVFFAVLMMNKKMPNLIAIPCMAILISIFAMFSPIEILNDVIEQGAYRLYAPIIAAMFGAIFAQVIQKTNIANCIVHYAAEFCGDNPFALAFVLTFATAFIFTSVSGFGAVMMVGTVILPILISVGIAPIVAAILLIMGLNLGGLFNIANYSFYNQTLKIPIHSIRNCTLIFSIPSTIIIILFIILNVHKSKNVFCCSTIRPPIAKLKWYSLISPIIPIFLLITWPLIFKCSINIISATLIGILYAIITTYPKQIVNILLESILDGIKDCSPVIALMLGIGMLLQVVSNTTVSDIMLPIIKTIIPSSKLTYILIFFTLCPLALFRGPLNLFGLGSGIGLLMLNTELLNPLAILGALLAIGAMQGICDPTNTHNVWVANYVNVDTSRLLKKSLPYVLLQILINLIITSILFV